MIAYTKDEYMSTWNLRTGGAESDFLNLLTEEKDAEHYYTSSPYSTLNNADYDGKLTKDIFCTHLRVESPKAVKNSDRITKNALEGLTASTNTALVRGTKGSGKTTFIYYTTDKILEQAETSSRFSLITRFDFERCVTAVDDPVKSFLIERLLSYIRLAANRNTLKELVGFFLINRDIITSELSSSGFEFFIVKALEDYLGELGKKGIEQNVDTLFNTQKTAENTLKELQTYELISLVMLINICKYLIMCNCGKRMLSLIVFDNLDIVRNGKNFQYTAEFIDGITTIHSKISNLVRQRTLKYRCDDDEKFLDINFYSDFYFILATRDITFANISNHFDRMLNKMIHIESSDCFEQEKIVEKRNSYIRTREEEMHLSLNVDFVSSSDMLEKLITNTYVNKHLFALFNHDYRTVIRNIDEIIQSGNDFCAQYLKLCRVSTYGANGMLLRKILNRLEKEKCFDRILAGRVGGDIVEGNNMSLARLILTFLRSASVQSSDSYEFGYPEVTLDSFAKSFLFLRESSHYIAQSICNMHNLSEDFHFWKHLLVLHADYERTTDNVDNRLNLFFNDKKSDYRNEDGRLRLSHGGNAFLSVICNHFEYFSCRYSNKSKSLFNDVYYSKGDSGINQLKETLTTVFNSVVNCCKSVLANDALIFINAKKENENFNQFRQTSGFFYKVEGAGGTHYHTHVERIINQHIGYLNRYRMFILKLPAEMQPQGFQSRKSLISESVLSTIKQYVELALSYEKPEIINSGYIAQPALAYAFKACVDYIGSDYLNPFEINHANGESLLKK